MCTLTHIHNTVVHIYIIVVSEWIPSASALKRVSHNTKAALNADKEQAMKKAFDLFDKVRRVCVCVCV